MPEERRRSPRRAEDLELLSGWRLASLEERMSAVEEAVARREEVLDRRYMTRDQLLHVFVPRVEHDQRRDWTLRLLMLFVAAGQIVETVLLAGGHR